MPTIGLILKRPARLTWGPTDVAVIRIERSALGFGPGESWRDPDTRFGGSDKNEDEQFLIL
jgi:hypothetical protein